MADTERAKQAIDKHLRTEEGERTRPYLCEARVPTIGVGATTYLDGRKVRLSDPPITREQMNRMLEVEIDRYVNAVLAMVDGECTTNQLIALVICAYNIGLEALRGSTMIKQHRAGNYEAAARAFRLWNQYRPKGPGTPLEVHPVLDARRAREAAIYLTPDDHDEAPVARPPQAVEGESKLASSPINKGGIAAAGTGVIAVVTQAGESLATMSDPLRKVRELFLDQLGISPDWFLPLVMIGVGCAIIYWRHKQRTEGWA
jgi:lysozyme